MFNWTISYRRDSDISIPNNRWVYYDERVQQNANLDHNYAANKTKKASYGIAVFLSNIRYRYVCVPQFVMPRGIQTTKPLFLLFPVSVSSSPKQYISHHQIYM
jgi:hypothetical protein